jgi:rod shape determining protein RodA
MFEPTLNERKSRLDWLMLGCLLGLMVIGTAFVYSATMTTATESELVWYNQKWVRQLFWYGLGLGVATGVCLIDYHLLSRWAMVIYWLTILSLVLVFFLGNTVFGARRWFDFGFFKLQPSEFAKLAFILVMAHFLSRPRDELALPGVFAKALGMMLLPFLLILKEPDLGSALMFLPAGLVMMYAAGVPTRFLKRIVGATGMLVLLLLVDILFAPPQWQIKLEDYQRRRLLVYFGLDYPLPPNATEADRLRAKRQRADDSYNIEQALISVGSGGLTGKGWRQGTQSALGYLPRAVAHNDFIFSVLAEESGFAGSVVVLTLYTVILFTGIRIASQARDRLGKLLAVGVVTLLFSHVFINIGMNIRIMPVTGVPLPLLSYGGSSVLCSLIAAGLLQNVYLHRRDH